MFEIFTTPEAWMALFTLILLEVFVSIDNVVFISFATEKLPKGTQKKTIYSGFALAILLRILLLFSITLLLSLKKPFLLLDTDWISASLSVQSLLLFMGGLFLLYKGTKELIEKIEDRRHDEREVKRECATNFSKALTQLFVINMVFSLDFVLSGVGLTHGITTDDYDALVIILLAALLSLFLMISFAKKLNALVEKHPSLKVLGLAFMLLIGFALVADAAHTSHITLLESTANALSKGYLYFVMIFCALIVVVELFRKKKSVAE
jgi:predicted tellurium resistance membrane protein TerC